MLDGGLELCTDAAAATFGYEINAVTSQWFYNNLTFDFAAEDLPALRREVEEVAARIRALVTAAPEDGES
jgi:hypothetical protein